MWILFVENSGKGFRGVKESMLSNVYGFWRMTLFVGLNGKNGSPQNKVVALDPWLCYVAARSF